MTGQRSELALLEDKVIVWPFWRFFWMCHMIPTESAASKEESLMTFSWHLDLLKKTKSSVVNAFMIWWPEPDG
jgi:hypothetical protein